MGQRVAVPPYFVNEPGAAKPGLLGQVAEGVAEEEVDGEVGGEEGEDLAVCGVRGEGDGGEGGGVGH